MANLFFDLPVPAGNGFGPPVDISGMGGEKTITVQDPFRGTINIQTSCDGGNTWAQVVTFTATGKRVFSFAGDFIRVQRSGVPAINPGLPNIDVSASDAGGLFAVLPSNGSAVDTSLLGKHKTVIVQHLSQGGTINIQVSDDQIRWATCMTFKASDIKFRDFTAKWMRAVGSGAVVSVGAINDAGGGSGVDEKVKASAADTTPGFLNTKLANGSGIGLAILNGGADESVEISVVAADAGNITTGDPVTVRGATNAEGAGAPIARADHEHRLEVEVEDEGVLAGARPAINFVGVGVGAADDPGNDRVNVTIPGTSDGGAVVKRSQYLGNTVSTSGNSFVSAMSGSPVVVPIDGDYWVIFEGEGMNSNANAVMEIGIGVNSTAIAIANSERDSQGNASDHRPVITTVQLPGLVTGDLVRALFRKKSGAQSVSLMRRHLSIFKVQ